MRPTRLVRVLGLLLLLAVLSMADTPQPGPFKDCPEQGRGGDPDLNRLKNRSAQITSAEPMTVAQITALPDPHMPPRTHRTHWPQNVRAQVALLEQKGVVVEGFLVGAKQEGLESPNCYNPQLRDYHLWVTDEQTQNRATAVVAEISPRWRLANTGWRLHTLTRLARQRGKVKITGWLMLDPEHPDQIGQTRGGLWEMHPITKIEVWTGSTWVELAAHTAPGPSARACTPRHSAPSP